MIQKRKILKDVAAGMVHLEKENIIHRYAIFSLFSLKCRFLEIWLLVMYF